MIEPIQITLPVYAVRYLKEMCASERRYLAEITAETFGPTLAMQAAYDSLNAIEAALPEWPQP